MYTIWGKADSVKQIAPGIVNVSTPSHGGYILSKDRLAEMPECLRACSYTGDNNFEEDCSWCAVVLTWPQFFEADHVAMAHHTYDYCYGPNKRYA